MSKVTKQVRAYNVTIGDELAFFDAKAQRGCTMVVHGFDRRGTSAGPYAVVLTVVRKGARRRQRYLLPFKWRSLVRVTRRTP
jgi:hypothetical protein